MAMKSFVPVLFAALALFAFATPSDAARDLLTTSPSCGDACSKMNQLVLSATIRGHFLSCASTGSPLGYPHCSPKNGPVRGCKKAPLTPAMKNKIDALLVDVKVELLALIDVLGVDLAVIGEVDLEVFIRTVLAGATKKDCSTFNPYHGDNEVLLTAFILADLHVNLLVSCKYLLRVSAYVNVVVRVLATCQSNLATIQALLSVCLDVTLFAGLKVGAIVDACIKYLDCGLCAVLGIRLQVILASVLSLVGSLLGGLLGGLTINLDALLVVFLNLCGILKACLVVVV